MWDTLILMLFLTLISFTALVTVYGLFFLLIAIL